MNFDACTFAVSIHQKIKKDMVTIVLLVLNLLTNSLTTVHTNENGKQQIQNASEFVILDEISQ